MIEERETSAEQEGPASSMTPARLVACERASAAMAMSRALEEGVKGAGTSVACYDMLRC